MLKKISILFVLTLLAYSNALAVEQYDFERNNPLPVEPRFTTNFGEFRNTSGYTQHDGLDYKVNSGTEVYPITGGTVTTGNGGGWGKYVIVTSNKNGKTFESRYAHLSRIFVRTGDTVTSEAILGLSGNTGNSTGPHLHFSVGPTVVPDNTVNPIIAGLKQAKYGDAIIAPIDSKQKIISRKIENCIVFYNESTKKKINASTINTPVKIIAEAYQNLDLTYKKSNPYKITFTIRKKSDSSYIQHKSPEIVFNDLTFDQNNYYCFTPPFKTVSSTQEYNEYYFMDWTPTDPGTYEVEVKAYVAYWQGDNLIAPTAANPDLGLTDIRTREIYISADYLYNMVDPTGMYAWSPPLAIASGIRALGATATETISWPAPKYATDLSNTIFTTNITYVDPDFQKETVFTYSAMRNTDFTIRIKNMSGTEVHSLTASGTEGEVHWDGSGVGEGTYKYEIEARDPLTNTVSTKEGISLITIDNSAPLVMATVFPSVQSITHSAESTSVQFYPDEDLTSCVVNIVDATNQSSCIVQGLGRYPRLKANEVVNLTWDGAGYYGDGSYQFEVVMTDLAGNINKRYSNPVVVNISGTYVPANLGPTVLPLPPEKDRAIITDFTWDAAGNKYVLYGKQGKLIKYNSSGEKVAEDDGRMGLNCPQAFTISPRTGRIYVADTYNNRVVVYDNDLRYSAIVSEGVINYLREWGISDYALGCIYAGSHIDPMGPCPAGTFYKPTDIKIASDEQIYVVDSANHRILKFEEYSYYLKPGEVIKGIKYDATARIYFVIYKCFSNRIPHNFNGYS